MKPQLKVCIGCKYCYIDSVDKKGFQLITCVLNKTEFPFAIPLAYIKDQNGAFKYFQTNATLPENCPKKTEHGD